MVTVRYRCRPSTNTRCLWRRAGSPGLFLTAPEPATRPDGVSSLEETQMRTPIRWIRVPGIFVALLLLYMTRADV
jgi:hypothetical protein